jgi:site-specific DNA recombinase
MKAAIYLRVSTEEQNINGYGLDAQREKCNAYATVKDWDVVSEHIDDISGTLDETQRPGLAAILTAACAGDVDAIIVASLDRLGRSTPIVLSIVDRLIECGTELASCKETLDTSTPTGRFVLRMFASLAELDRDNIVARTTDGRNARGKRDGEKGGRVPMGYVRTFTDGKAVGVEIDNEGATLVRNIFTMRSDMMTLTEIADTLNESGETTARGGGWHASSVRQILLNENKYKGGNRGESDEHWPRII